MNLKQYIRDIQDFPIEGVLFRDITTVLKNPIALKQSVDTMISTIKDLEFDTILGPESRGFIFGMPMAYILNKGFVPVRKSGKLPAEVVKKEYDLEYGTATIEIHKDAVKKGQRFIIADDLLATGGTAKAIYDLIKELGGEVVASVFFIELQNLGGRKTLENENIKSVIVY